MSFQTFVTERLAAITDSLNAIGTNAKRIFELPAQTTLDPASLIHVSRGETSESLEVQKIIDAINNGNYSQLISVGEITVTGLIVSVPSGVEWVYESINYQTTTITNITETLCAAGYLRKDILIANQSNQILLIKGAESETIRIRPNIPIGSILVTEIDVDDTIVGTPSTPVVGNIYVKLTENQTINGTKTFSKPIKLSSQTTYNENEIYTEADEFIVKNIDGLIPFKVKRGVLSLRTISNNLLRFLYTISGNRDLTIPDKSGTIALLDDITPFANWTQTEDNIRNNNIGNVEIKINTGKKVSFLDNSNGKVASINERGDITANFIYPATIQFPIGRGLLIGGTQGVNYFNGYTGRWQTDVLIKYASDLSSTYDSRSLVDKGYTDSKLAEKITYKSKETYALMIADGTPSVPTLYTITADENKSYVRSTYLWQPNGNREWIATTPDN